MSRKLSFVVLGVLIPLAGAVDAQGPADECWKLDGPVLVSVDGGYPSDWPASLNIPAMTVAAYEACMLLRQTSVTIGDLHPEDPEWVQANAEALLPGDPTEWNEEPDHGPLDIIPSPDPTRIGVPIPSAPGEPDPNAYRVYVIPSDDVNKAKAGCQNASTSEAIGIIKSYFSIPPESMDWYCLENVWHNNSPESNFEDLKNFWYNSDLRGPGRFAMGWVHERDQNGAAEGCRGEVAIGGETRRGGVDWPHAQITMHELSHLWCANDDGYFCNEGDGVMNYCEAYWGAEEWDKDATRVICAYFQTCHV